MANQSEIETVQKRFIVGTEIHIEKARGDNLTFSGYVSTKQPDLMGDVCPADSWDEFLPMFKANPLYCYDHWLSRKGDNSEIGATPPYPIGKVLNPYTDSEGLMLDGITLVTSIPFVKDVISPLIQEGVLKQQSVGFLAFEKKPGRDGYRYLTRNMIQEGSIVPLAANPFGTDISLKNLGLNMQVVDGFADFSTVDLLIKAYEEGKVVLAKQFFMADHGQDFSKPASTDQHKSNKPMKSLEPEFDKVVPTAHNANAYDPEGEAVAKPPKYDKSYADVCGNIYAASRESDSEKSFLFQIAVPTEKGFKYDFDLLAVATAKVLGAKGGAKWVGDEKKLVLERLAEAYEVIGKKFPSYFRTPQEPISKMAGWKLEDVSYQEVEFHEGENDVVKRSIAKNDAANLLAALKSGGIEDLAEVEELSKYLSGSLNVTLSAYGWEPAEMDFLIGIVNAWNDFNKAAQDSWMTYSFRAWHEDGELKFAKVGKDSEGNDKAVAYAKSGDTFVSTGDAVEVPEGASEVGDLDAYTRFKSVHESIGAKVSELESALKFPEAPKVENKRFAETMRRVNSYDI